MIVLGVACAGAIGAVTRYVVDIVVSDRTRTNLPVGTMVINVRGSFVLGILTGLALYHGDRHLRVQRDGVEGVLVDRQPDEPGVGPFTKQRGGLAGLGRYQLQVHPRSPLGPCAAPPVHGDAGHDEQAERRGMAIGGDGHGASEASTGPTPANGRRCHGTEPGQGTGRRPPAGDGGPRSPGDVPGRLPGRYADPGEQAEEVPGDEAVHGGAEA